MKKIIFLLIFQTILLNAEKLGWGNEVPLDLIRSILPPDPIILEAGAHYAQDTCWMAQTWPKGTIHAFEPTPANFNYVYKAAQTFPNIKCYTYALDNECGIKSFYQDGDEDKGNQGANSLLLHKILQKSSNPPIQVECITIDEWAAKMNVDHIDFMWLDIEGNELNALMGALNILPSVKAIFTEVNFKEFWHGAVQYDTLKSWLEQNNFKEAWKDIRPNWNGNVLFVRK
jgi:2-O-methyltransferase